MNSNNIAPKKIEEDEIDLLALVKNIWKNRKTILKTTIIFGVLGLTIAILSPKEYTATSVMVPQISNPQSKLGGLSNLAAIAGLNLSTVNSSDLSPVIYPQIVFSVPFQLELINTSIKFDQLDKPITLFEYFTEIKKPNPLLKYTIGLPGVLLKAVRKQPKTMFALDSLNPFIQLTEDQNKIIKTISDLISINVNDKDGYVSLSCKMPEPLAAAQFALRAQELLQNYITEFKIKKAKANHDFIQGRYNEVKMNYQNAQEQLAIFRDRNKNVSTALAKTEEERLTGEYALLYNVYSELAKQLEQAKIQLKEETPVFTIIEPVSVPSEKSKPKRLIILLIWTFLGGLVGLGIIFGKEFMVTIKEQWKEK